MKLLFSAGWFALLATLAFAWAGFHLALLVSFVCFYLLVYGCDLMRAARSRIGASRRRADSSTPRPAQPGRASLLTVNPKSILH